MSIDAHDVRGVQQPRVHSAPAYSRTLGREVVEFMAQVGKPLDPWQQLMVLDTFGLRDDGYWAAFECVGLVPRQNGKGGYTEAVELGGLFLFGDQLIMHSAHLFKTSKQSFQRVIDIIDGSDWLTKRVHKVTRARGDEEIELTAKAGGGKLMYFSRSGGAGRGFTGDKTVFDECAYLTVEQYQAATPTLATVPNPQIIYTGTPPDEDIGPMPEDAMMPSVRRRGHAGGDRIALWEWSPPEGFDRTDPKVWAQCNPSLGERIQPWFLAKQLDNFTEAGKPEKFDTEHLGVWPVYTDGPTLWQVVPAADWEAAKWPDMPPPEQFALAVAIAPDLSHACICKAGPVGDGLFGVAVLEWHEGVSWVTDRLYQLCAVTMPLAVVIDRNSAAEQCWLEVEARDNNADWAALKLTDVMVPITPRDECAAANAIYNGISGVQTPPDPDGADVAINPRTVRHRDQQVLTTAVAVAQKKPSGSTWRWDELASDVTALKGAGEALHGFLKRQPPTEAPWIWDGVL